MTSSQCECGREIPTPALWCCLASGRPLRCTDCGQLTKPDDVLTLLESNEDASRIAIVVYLHLTRYGWTSAKAIDNLLHVEDPRVIGGVLSGLQRAGLIERVLEPNVSSSVAALIVDPHPTFVPGPRFPIK